MLIQPLFCPRVIQLPRNNFLLLVLLLAHPKTTHPGSLKRRDGFLETAFLSWSISLANHASHFVRYSRNESGSSSTAFF